MKSCLERRARVKTMLPRLARISPLRLVVCLGHASDPLKVVRLTNLLQITTRNMNLCILCVLLFFLLFPGVACCCLRDNFVGSASCARRQFSLGYFLERNAIPPMLKNMLLLKIASESPPDPQVFSMGPCRPRQAPEKLGVLPAVRAACFPPTPRCSLLLPPLSGSLFCPVCPETSSSALQKGKRRTSPSYAVTVSHHWALWGVLGTLPEASSFKCCDT